MTQATAGLGRGRAMRRLSWPMLIVLIVVFLLVPQVVSLFLFGVTALDEGYQSVRGGLAAELVPDLGGAMIAAGVIVWLGWTREVLFEPRRTRAWVVTVPLALIAASLVAVDWSRLASVGVRLVLTLAGATLSTGLSEELLFRGITLKAMRDRYRELPAALLGSVLFGATHLINAIVIGSGAVPQALLATGMGYLLYLTRRVSGGLALPIAVHALYDFSVFSSQVGPGPSDPLSDAGMALLLVELALVIVVAVWHRSIEAHPPSAAKDGGEASHAA